jgi:hypothetical protein
MKKIFLTSFFLTLFILSIVSCTEPYALQTNAFEDAIVVEATITNELKKQEIKLSRTYRFEDNGPKFETGAIVYVKDNLGNQYDFEEINGKYFSVSEFQAVANRNYQLHITTSDGKSYSSSNEKLTTVNPIQSITPSITIREGVRGVQILVNSFDPTNTSKYYRFEYEETNKIEAPKWSPNKANGIYTYDQYGAFTGGYIVNNPWGRETKICYTTKKSQNIILTNTSSLSEDRVNYPVRFISSQDYIIANRYSIWVKQYVQNLQSYTFYKTLKTISSSESILSQNQPGFLLGNMKSDTNPNEKVVGFFDVSSYSEKRIFFNYHDVFPGEAFPKYPFDCEIDQNNLAKNFKKFCFNPFDFSCQGNELIDGLNNNQIVLYSVSGLDHEVYPTPCGDCTSFSNNIRPTFWID